MVTPRRSFLHTQAHSESSDTCRSGSPHNAHGIIKATALQQLVPFALVADRVQLVSMVCPSSRVPVSEHGSGSRYRLYHLETRGGYVLRDLLATDFSSSEVIFHTSGLLSDYFLAATAWLVITLTGKVWRDGLRRVVGLSEPGAAALAVGAVDLRWLRFFCHRCCLESARSHDSERSAHV